MQIKNKQPGFYNLVAGFWQIENLAGFRVQRRALWLCLQVRKAAIFFTRKSPFTGAKGFVLSRH
jgi:hypothetical protein